MTQKNCKEEGGGVRDGGKHNRKRFGVSNFY